MAQQTRRFRILDAMALTLAFAIAATFLANYPFHEQRIKVTLFTGTLWLTIVVPSALTLVLAGLMIGNPRLLRESSVGFGKLALLLISAATVVNTLSRVPVHLNHQSFSPVMSLAFDIFVGPHSTGLAGLIAVCSWIAVRVLRVDCTDTDWIEITGRGIAALAFLFLCTKALWFGQ